MQWSETAIANLQKAAHLVDMRLGRPKDLLQRLKYTSGEGMAHLTLRYTIDQLEELKGVTEVDIKWSSPSHMPQGMGGPTGGHHDAKLLEISTPVYKWKSGDSSVSLVSLIEDPGNKEEGSIRVKISISDLVNMLAKSDWWKSNRTLLIDMEGNVIAQSSYESGSVTDPVQKRFGAQDPLEKETLAEIQKRSHGTVFGEGNPPGEISGFYRLTDAPWYMVVLAPGKTVLQPILNFRLYYGLLFASAIIIIIVFIRSMTTKMTSSIHKLSIAAEDLANGVFGQPLPVQSYDEIGELTMSFNTMTAQIKQGVALQKAMEIAREVQQNFLPSSRYVAEGINIYGFSRYCQDTGGDFFDLVRFKNDPEKAGAIVGDVVGHGIGAALLMASVRAMVRSRNDQPGDLAAIITDVNRVLCYDTEATSNFVTLFYITVDLHNRTLEWVRAGHDPALLLYPGRKESVELLGNGVALGVDQSLEYQSNTIEITDEEQLVVIGSDGAWEAANRQGEMFGKQRLKHIIANNSSEEPEGIIELINEEIDSFLDGIPPQDDITFVVVKIAANKKA